MQLDVVYVLREPIRQLGQLRVCGVLLALILQLQGQSLLANLVLLVSMRPRGVLHLVLHVVLAFIRLARQRAAHLLLLAQYAHLDMQAQLQILAF